MLVLIESLDFTSSINANAWRAFNLTPIEG